MWLQSVTVLFPCLQNGPVFRASNYEGLQICSAPGKAPKTEEGSSSVLCKLAPIMIAPGSFSGQRTHRCFSGVWTCLAVGAVRSWTSPDWGCRTGTFGPTVPLGGGMLSAVPGLSCCFRTSLTFQVTLYPPKGERSNANDSHLGPWLCPPPPGSLGSVWRHFSLSHRAGRLLIPGGEWTLSSS